MSKQYGWTGKILRVDLTKGELSTIDTFKYVPKYIGGMGVAYRIAWEEIPKGTGAFDPENRLMIMVGPLTGTAVPTSGRAEVLAVSAQSYPEQIVCSGVGGWFPAKLKWAGFDGIVFQGKAPSPVYLLIRNGVPEIKSADGLWGLGTFDTQAQFRNLFGKDSECYSIGPAGENMSRIASIQAITGRAAGQGGLGGVMGSKNLKAVCISGGTHKIEVADPEEVLRIRAEIQPVKRKNPIQQHDVDQDEAYDYYVKDYPNGPYKFRRKGCSHSCFGSCGFWDHIQVPAATHTGVITGEAG